MDEKLTFETLSVIASNLTIAYFTFTGQKELNKESNSNEDFNVVYQRYLQAIERLKGDQPEPEEKKPGFFSMKP